MNIIIAIAVFYLATTLLGRLIEKIKIPRIYAALFLGVALSTNPTVLEIVSERPIYILTQIGMFCLLFLLGFNLDIGQIRKQKNLIVKVTFWMILAEVIIGTLLLHTIFSVDWSLAGFIALSFATVGEVAILPILKEFNLIKTKLGQAILGVSILDDTIEILSFLLLTFYISTFSASEIAGELVPLIAIISGVILRKVKKASPQIERLISLLALTIFGPTFFFYAGAEADVTVFIHKFSIILMITLAIKVTKLCSVYLSSVRNLGSKRSIIMAVSLSIKFSTSIIILLILLQRGLITQELFSVLIGVKVLFKFITPLLLSFLLKKWELTLEPEEDLLSQSKRVSHAIKVQ